MFEFFEAEISVLSILSFSSLHALTGITSHFLFLIAMEDIFIGTPSKDEIRRYFDRDPRTQRMPSASRSEGEREEEIFWSEDEFSESFEELLEKTFADKKRAKEEAGASLAFKDPAIMNKAEELEETQDFAGITAVPPFFELPTNAPREDTEEFAEDYSAIMKQPDESAMEDVDASITPDDSPTVASKNWIVNSSIVIATPTVGDRKMFLQRCFKKSNNEGAAFDVRPSFGAFIQQKKQQLEKQKTIVEVEAEESGDL